jgi:hypothetical protein
MLNYSNLSKLSPPPTKITNLCILFGGPQWVSAASLGLSLNEVYDAAIKVAVLNKNVEQRISLWACDCAMHVLHFFERERPNDFRPREAIYIGRKFARKQLGDAARAAARAAEEQWQLERLVYWLSEPNPLDFNPKEKK